MAGSKDECWLVKFLFYIRSVHTYTYRLAHNVSYIPLDYDFKRSKTYSLDLKFHIWLVYHFIYRISRRIFVSDVGVQSFLWVNNVEYITSETLWMSQTLLFLILPVYQCSVYMYVDIQVDRYTLCTYFH